MAKVSGLSVCSSCGSGERGESDVYKRQIEWRLALVLAITLPILIGFTLTQRVRMKKANLEVKRKTAEINSSIESGISGIRTAKAFANEKTEDSKFAEANERYKSAKKEYYNAMGGFMSGMEFTTSIMPVSYTHLAVYKRQPPA